MYLWKEQKHFCGQQSATSIYPRFQKVTLSTITHPSTIQFVSAQFQLQDTKVLVSVQTWRPFEENLNYLILSPDTWTLETVYLEVSKNKRILFHASNTDTNNSLLVLDGPGYQSQMVKPKGKFYNLTGFQSLVISLSRHCASDCSLHFQTETMPVGRKRVQLQIHVNLPDASTCIKSICVFAFFSSHKHQINLTVSALLYSGKSSEACKYGGFTTATYENETWAENAILCKTSLSPSAGHQSFYSSRSVLFAVLYQFQPYSVVNVTLFVTSTSCKFIQFCPCKFQHYCPPPEHLEKKKIQRSLTGTQFSQCLAFLSKLMEKHQVNFEYVFPNIFDMINILPHNNPCVVIKVARHYSCSLLQLVKTRHKGYSLTLYTTATKYHYTVRAELDQTLNNKSTWRSCMYKCGIKNMISVQYKILYTQTLPQKQYIFNQGVTVRPQNFFMDIKEPINAKNWIEVQLQHNKALNTKQGNNKTIHTGTGQQVHCQQSIEIFSFKGCSIGYLMQVCMKNINGNEAIWLWSQNQSISFGQESQFL